MIPAWWQKKPRPKCDNFEKCMRTFSLIIKHMAPSPHVFDIVHEVWDVCRKGCGLECEYKFLSSSKTIY